MHKLSSKVEFFLNLSKAKTVAGRRFDNRLSFRGLGFSDFAILHHIDQSPDGKMRRTDLAERVGLTQSGVTRILLPMEKIGLIKRKTDEYDARVSYVAITPAGKRLLEESIVDAENLVDDIFTQIKTPHLHEFSSLCEEIGKIVVY